MKQIFKYYVLYDVREKQYYYSTSGGDVHWIDEIGDARKFQDLDTIEDNMYDWEIEEIFSNNLIEVKMFLSTSNHF